MGKKEKDEKGPQEVVLSWSNQDQRQAILHSSLFQVAARLTQICHPSGGDPDEVVDTYIRIYDRVNDWYRGAPLKEDIKKMLDTLYPDPPGYAAGETLA